MTFLKSRAARLPDATLATHDLERDGALPATGFVATVPGTLAPLVPLDLPGVLRGAARARVARRQLRDTYGGADSGIDARPARLGDAADRWQALMVVATQTRLDWARKAAAAGPLCRAILPDYLVLPAARDLWVIEAAGPLIRVRLGLEDGFSAEPDLALALLQGARAKAPPRAVLRMGALAPDIDAWLAELGLVVCLDPSGLAAHGVTPPQRFAHGEFALDLARDPDAERAEMRKVLRSLGVVAGLGLMGLAGWIAAIMLETSALRAQGLAYRQNSERILREVVIPTGPILDIRTQVSRLVEDARAANADAADMARPLDVLRRAGAVLAAHEATVTRVSYQPAAGLVIDLQLADFAALDTLVAALREGGTELRVAQSVTRDDAGVEAVLAMAVTQKGAER